MTRKTKEIIEAIAAKYGVSPKEVERDMLEALRIGMASPDPTAQAMWQKIIPNGKEPDLDAFFDFFSKWNETEKD